MLITRRRLCEGALLAAASPTWATAADGEIVVGQIGPFTGIPVPDALQLNQGIKACFAQTAQRPGCDQIRCCHDRIKAAPRRQELSCSSRT